MATTNVPAMTIDAAGIHRPDYGAILAGFVLDYQATYGADVVLESSTQDGMWVAAQALAYSNACDAAVAVYDSFAPSSAQGVGLDRVVKVNGIARAVPTNSTVDQLNIGTVGVTVAAGVVNDGVNDWNLPTFTFPPSGQILVTATCATPGAVTAVANSVDSIQTPTLGWISSTNPMPAQPGAPLELDPALKARQTLSTELPSQGILEGIVGNVMALSGVTVVAPYENKTDVPDANGLPGHSFCLVVDGGDANTIATTIAAGRPCCGTYGTTQVPITDAYGVTQTVSFMRRTAVPLAVSVGIKPLTGFTAATQALIISSLVGHVNALGTGKSALIPRLYSPANLTGKAALAALLAVSPATLTADAARTLLGQYGQTYEVTYLYASRGGVPPSSADVPISFAEYATLAAGAVQLTLVTQ